MFVVGCSSVCYEKRQWSSSTDNTTDITACTAVSSTALPGQLITLQLRLLHRPITPSCCFFPADSVRSSLNEAKRLLTIELQEALNTTLQNTRALDELFDYLIQFSVTADLCPLHWNIRKVVEDLLLTNVVSMVMNQAEESAVVDLDSIEQEQLNCLKNITGPYIAEFTPRISLVFQKLLVDYKLYVRSINLGRKVVLTVQNHRWSPACMTALARIKHCAYCGGYTKFRPCLNFCLNTLRGCLADVAEIYEEYKSFVAAFHSLSKDIDSNLKPETLVSKQFREFVTMVTEVREQSSLEYLVRVHYSLISSYVYTYCSVCIYLVRVQHQSITYHITNCPH